MSEIENKAGKLDSLNKPKPITTKRNIMLLLFLVILGLIGVVLVFQSSRNNFVLLWGFEIITDIQPNSGFAYIGPNNHPKFSSHLESSLASILENGKEIGPSNALHDYIRETGLGANSIWNASIYLSSSDNTDPRANGRGYEIKYPKFFLSRTHLLQTMGLINLILISVYTFTWIKYSKTRSTDLKKKGYVWRALMGTLSLQMRLVFSDRKKRMMILLLFIFLIFLGISLSVQLGLNRNHNDPNLGNNYNLALDEAFKCVDQLSLDGGVSTTYTHRERNGEVELLAIDPNKIAMETIGTPDIGNLYLQAFEITGDRNFLAKAIRTAKFIINAQGPIGGWNKIILIDEIDRRNIFHPSPFYTGTCCTMDNNATQGALFFLINLNKYYSPSWLENNISLGLDFILKSQFENGGWPQWYPLQDNYHSMITFNDGAINNNIAVLLESYKRYGQEAYLEAAIKGLDFIIISQLHRPTAGWAAQYDQELNPAAGRSYEPPAVNAKVTSKNIATLTSAYIQFGDQKYLGPIIPAIDWLEQAKLPALDRYWSWDGFQLSWMTPDEIGSQVWARTYEVGNPKNVPIYMNREGNVTPVEEAYLGYEWQGTYDIPSNIETYQLAVNGKYDLESSEDPSNNNIGAITDDFINGHCWNHVSADTEIGQPEINDIIIRISSILLEINK